MCGGLLNYEHNLSDRPRVRPLKAPVLPLTVKSVVSKVEKRGLINE